MSLIPEKDHLKTSDFDYQLPETAIALFPLPIRDQSKLLVFKNGSSDHHQFYDLPDLLPENSLLIYNNTKVVPARLHFQRTSGAWIEILAIRELEENQTELLANQRCVECMVGNKKKWAIDEVLTRVDDSTGFRLEVSWFNRERNWVTFTWFPAHLSYYTVLAELGEMPIPPYLNRPSEDSDKENYQTIYSRNEGAIAAPTAGLHFTERVFNKLKAKGIPSVELTLHVGLGTFKPMKAEQVAEHEMHAEEVVISRQVLEQIALHIGPRVVVGTTSLRSLESLFWIGISLLKNGEIPDHLYSHEPYQWQETQTEFREVLQAILDEMKNRQLNEIRFFTQLYIMPGYRFQAVDALITNFHQPKSTLLVLVSAFVGDGWKSIYNEALEMGYRFLSYGDSSLLFPNPTD